MQELIDAGYVYIAKPPLYKLKQRQPGDATSRRSPSSRSSCSRDKLEKFERRRPRRQGSSSSPRRAGRRSRRAAQAVRGLGDRRCGRVTATTSCASSRSRRCSTSGVDERRRRREARSSEPTTRASPSTTELLERRRRASSSSRRSSARPASPQTHRLAGGRCSTRTEYRQLRRGPRASCVKLAGTPPFQVTLGDTRDEAALVRGAAPRGARARPAGRHSCSASRAWAR